MKRDRQATIVEMVNQWRESGLPIRVFAQNAGISKSKLDYWIRKQKYSQGHRLQNPAFIEVGTISDSVEQPITEKSIIRKVPQIELTLPNGLCLKIYG